jgi:hypothetical protein
MHELMVMKEAGPSRPLDKRSGPYSITTSSHADAPRGMEFLYSANRLNVATSRAKCVCILVGSPRVFEAECRTPRQMQLANAFCRYLEMATCEAPVSGSRALSRYLVARRRKCIYRAQKCVILARGDATLNHKGGGIAMPIRLELRPLYPPHWRELSSHVRFERAGGRCQRCGRPHLAPPSSPSLPA